MGGQIMQLIKWNPSRDIFSLRNHFNTLFDDFFYPSRRRAAEEGMWSWNPAVDIYEEGDNIIRTLSLTSTLIPSLVTPGSSA